MARVSTALGLALASLVAAGDARARDDDKRVCLDGYQQGQEHRLAHRYRAAREALIRCADRTCPGFMQTECTRWLAEAESAQPSIVLEIVGPGESERSLTGLRVDGQLRSDPLDGRAIDVDPGEHSFVLTSSGIDAEQRIVIRDGEKRRRVVFRIASPSALSEKGGWPATAWAFGAVGVVALGSAAFFGASGVIMQNDRDATCSPRCPQSDVDALRTKYLVADVSLGLAVLSAGAFAWILLTRDAANPPKNNVSVRQRRDAPFLGAAF